MSVADRLGRLLVAVPVVAERGSMPLDELAGMLDVAPKKLERDLLMLSMVGAPPRTPDQLIDVDIEDGVVSVHLDQRLDRPPALTYDEVQALIVAVASARTHRGDDAPLEHSAQALLECVSPAERQPLQRLLGGVRTQTETGDADLRAQLDDATRACFEVELEYYSAQSDALKRYRLKPLALVLHRGAEYLVALDADQADHEKLFRLDRVESLRVSEVEFEAEAPDLSRFRTDRLYFGDDGRACRVRFAPNHRAFAQERFQAEDLEIEADGAVVATLNNATVDYVVRFVAGFCGEAEVLSPPEFRQAVADWARGVNVRQ